MVYKFFPIRTPFGGDAHKKLPVHVSCRGLSALIAWENVIAVNAVVGEDITAYWGNYCWLHPSIICGPSYDSGYTCNRRGVATPLCWKTVHIKQLLSIKPGIQCHPKVSCTLLSPLALIVLKVNW